MRMSAFFIIGLAFVTFMLPAPSWACMWDSDTLAHEAKGLPDVIQVIVGRFERNPPLYYQMRLKRVTAELRLNSKLLGDYDDAGVACDRLKRDDEAIVWMQKKRAQLLKANQSDPAIQDHWYRYYANIGTFYAHRWIRSGADRRRINEVKIARDDIAEAIKINPNAHFGREKYQLQVLNWIIKPVTDQSACATYASLLSLFPPPPGFGDPNALMGTALPTDPYGQGVFLVDRWLTTWSRQSNHIQENALHNLGDVKTARAEIAWALAHDLHTEKSRAWQQLQTLDRILRQPVTDFDPSWEKAGLLSDYTLGEGNDFESSVKGVTGLIVLGDAWESVDVFSTLSKLMFYGGPSMKQNIAYMADLRCGELIDQGHHSLMPGAPSGKNLKDQLDLYSEQVTHEQELKAIYPRLRAEAEAWRQKRAAYMMVRLRAGRHPDTDPTFWNDWHDVPPPSLDFSDVTASESRRRGALWTVAGLGFLAVTVALGRLFRQRRYVMRIHK